MPANYFRTSTLKRSPGDPAEPMPAEGGTFDLSISSEEPYERSFGIEILSHDATAVDLTRLGDGRHPLLLNHCTDDQIGVIEKAYIGDDKKLRGVARFSRSELGQEIQLDVEGGIRSLVSVGYFIEEIEEVEPVPNPDTGIIEYKPLRTLSGEDFAREMRALHGDSWNRSGTAAARAQGSEPPTYIVTRWCPFEASVVPVPADASVGFGRSAGAGTDPQRRTVAPVAPEPSPVSHIPSVEIIMTQVVKTGAELEIERRDRLASIGEQYAKYLKPNDTANAIRSGQSVEAFIEFIMERMAAKHTDTSEVAIGLTPKEIKRYSLGKAIVASMTGDWRDAGFERECSEAVGKILGRGAEGFFAPPEAFMRDFNVGTASEAGNLVATDLRSDLYVDVLRNNLVMNQLGIVVLGGLSSNVDLPRKATAGSIGTVTEIGSATETAPATAKVTLSPKRQTAYTEVSKQALIQSAMSLEALIRDDLLSGVAVQIENQIINGTGTAPQMTGIRYTSGIGTVAAGTNGGTVTWGNVVGLETACANSNAEPDRLAGYLFNTKQRGNLKQIQQGTNLPFIWQNGPQAVNGYRALVSNNVPSNLTKGTSTTVCSAAIFGSDWSMGVLGLFGAPDITVDPYSAAVTGQVRITLNQFADFGVRQPACFAKVEDLL